MGAGIKKYLAFNFLVIFCNEIFTKIKRAILYQKMLNLLVSLQMHVSEISNMDSLFCWRFPSGGPRPAGPHERLFWWPPQRRGSGWRCPRAMTMKPERAIWPIICRANISLTLSSSRLREGTGASTICDQLTVFSDLYFMTYFGVNIPKASKEAKFHASRKKCECKLLCLWPITGSAGSCPCSGKGDG